MKNRELYRICLLIIFSILIFQISSRAQRKPVVYIIGDSTVKNGRGDGAGGLWGWGDPLALCFDTSRVRVENHALGGTSSRTFQDKGLWEEVRNRLQSGDFVLMQFGHNDNGPLNDTVRARGTIKGTGTDSLEIDNLLTGRHETVHSYGWYLRKMVGEAKEKGAIPVMVTPIPRNDWENGKIRRTPESYPRWALEVARQERIHAIDLNLLMSDKLDSFGEAHVTGKYFYSRDHTHTSAEGAKLNASLIVEALRAIPDLELHQYLFPNSISEFPVKKRIFIIGDSTVADGNDTIVGWGRLLPAFFDTSRAVIINKARGGRSSRTFFNEGLWKAMLTDLRNGDFVVMQFGHNDSARPDAEKFRGSLRGTGEETMDVKKPDGTIETVHTYGWYLKKYIEDAKGKGAVPVVLSQVPRNEWPNGKVERVTESYGKWAMEAAHQANACFIDLNELIALKYEELGAARVKTFFPGDHTHTNFAGAELNAKILAEGISRLKGCNMKACLKEQ